MPERTYRDRMTWPSKIYLYVAEIQEAKALTTLIAVDVANFD